MNTHDIDMQDPNAIADALRGMRDLAWESENTNYEFIGKWIYAKQRLIGTLASLPDADDVILSLRDEWMASLDLDAENAFLGMSDVLALNASAGWSADTVNWIRALEQTHPKLAQDAGAYSLGVLAEEGEFELASRCLTAPMDELDEDLERHEATNFPSEFQAEFRRSGYQHLREKAKLFLTILRHTGRDQEADEVATFLDRLP